MASRCARSVARQSGPCGGGDGASFPTGYAGHLGAAVLPHSAGTSTPRITIWRKLKRLGVAQIADGLIALPVDAPTREHLDRIADDILDAGGTAAIWLAQPTTAATERDLATAMATARAAEYTKVTTEATAAAHHDQTARLALARRLHAELRRIHRRDYFPPHERDTAAAAVDALANPVPDPKEEPGSVALSDHT